MRKVEDEVRGLLRSGRGNDNGSLVRAQHAQPRRQIACVFELAVDAAMGAEEGSAHLGHQLFDGISIITKPLSELASAP